MQQVRFQFPDGLGQCYLLPQRISRAAKLNDMEVFRFFQAPVLPRSNEYVIFITVFPLLQFFQCPCHACLCGKCVGLRWRFSFCCLSFLFPFKDSCDVAHGRGDYQYGQRPESAPEFAADFPFGHGHQKSDE